jgi:predicted transcriptional regulator YdeE
MESCRADLQIVQPRRVQRAESYVMGIELCVANPTAAHPVTAEIPKLWQRFSAEALLDIPDPVDPGVLYGVYTDYSSDPQRQHSVIMAVEVSSIDNPPENMVGILIPAGDYLVFEASGTSPVAVSQAWQQVEAYLATSPYKRAFTTDFERYDQQQVKIYVAIKPV